MSNLRTVFTTVKKVSSFFTVVNAISQRSEKSQFNKRVSERNSKLNLSRYFSDKFKHTVFKNLQKSCVNYSIHKCHENDIICNYFWSSSMTLEKRMFKFSNLKLKLSRVLQSKTRKQAVRRVIFASVRGSKIRI